MTDFVLWKSLVSEFLGTFLLVLVGTSAVAQSIAQGGSIVGSAFAFGLALMSLFYAFGSFSGAHFNPAVSFGFAVAGRMPWGLMFLYVITQLLGGIAAACLTQYFYGNAGPSIGSLTNTDGWKAFLVEAFLTFILVLVVLFVTRNPLLAVASGLAIGLVLTFDMLAGLPLTGASMNPARSLGSAIFSNNMGTYWIYIVGPLVGALVAALVYRLFTYEYNCCTKVDECGNVVTDECGNPLKECCREVVDNCGCPVLDCDGCPVTETYTKHERKLGFMQENFITTIGQMMSSHGFDPRYVKQEFDRAVEKAVPNGVVKDPQAIVKGTLERAVPAVQSRSAELMATDPVSRFNMNQSYFGPEVDRMANSIIGGVNTNMSGVNSSLNSMGSQMALSALAPTY